MWVFALFLSSLAVSAFAELGKCPKRKVQDDFDLEKFAGVWYEIESTAPLDKSARRCSTYTVQYNGKKGKSGLLLKYISVATGKKKDQYLDISTPDNSESGKLQISPLKGAVIDKKFHWYIIYTDYNVVVLTSCREIPLIHFEDVYILSKSRTLDDKKKMELYDLLKNNDIKQKNLEKINQSHKDCSEETTTVSS